MNIKILLFLFSITSMVFAQEVAVSKVVFNDDFSIINDEGNFIITNSGVVTFKDFSFKLFDSENHVEYEAGKYLGLIYKNILLADMVIETADGGMRYTLLANYFDKSIIFHKNIGDEPNGLTSAIGIGDLVILLYSSQAICFDTNTNKLVWETVWNERDSLGRINVQKLLKSFSVTEQYVEIKLRNSRLIRMDFKTGNIK